MKTAIREYTQDFSDIYWLGYIAAWIGAFGIALNGMPVICYTIYAFGLIVLLIETFTIYYRDYFVSAQDTTTDAEATH